MAGIFSSRSRQRLNPMVHRRGVNAPVATSQVRLEKLAQAVRG